MVPTFFFKMPFMLQQIYKFCFALNYIIILLQNKVGSVAKKFKMIKIC